MGNSLNVTASAREGEKIVLRGVQKMHGMIVAFRMLFCRVFSLHLPYAETFVLFWRQPRGFGVSGLPSAKKWY
jgi:hypothetical protein